MLRENIQKYRLLFIAVFVCILAVVFWVLFPNKSSSENNGETGISLADIPLESRKVFIEGFHVYQDDHDPHTGVHEHGSIENTLYTYVGKDKPGLYTGTIRAGSFKETSETSAELLVDIEPSQTTYVIKLLNPDKKGYRPFSVACAPEDQQIEPNSKCIDGGLPL